MKIVMPMAGEGRRFKEAGYVAYSKPFLPLRDGTPMYKGATECMGVDPESADVLYLVNQKDSRRLEDRYLRQVIYNKTEGAACTVLMAEEWIDEATPLMILNCDQLLFFSQLNFDALRRQPDVDGIVFVFRSDEPRWSYVDIDANGLVTRAAEKKVISPWATCGAYYFRRGYDFVDAAKKMIEANDRTNNEFYVCPVLNHMPSKRIYAFEVEKMVSLGTPEDYEKYLDAVHCP